MRVAALAAALTAAAVLPGKPAGAGVLVVAALIALTVGLGCRLTVEAAVYGALALGLAAQAVLLDAGWVVALDLIAECALATVAACGPRISSLAAPVVRLADAPPLAPTLTGGVAAVARGAALGIVVVAPFAFLFTVGDHAFFLLTQEVPLPASESVPGHVAAFAFVLAGALGLTLAARRPFGRAMPPPRRKLTLWEWALPLALLDALFLAFVVVQLAVLFGGHECVLGEDGLTYAEYARMGYFELLTAAALTLVVIGAAAFFADAPSRSHRLVLRGLVGVLCSLTAVVLFSALHRLGLYEDAYGLTRLRLVAEVGAFWLGGLFALVVLAGLLPLVRRRLTHVVVAGTALTLLVFSLANPDRLIAERNVDHWRKTGEADYLYLRRLSADAAPALAVLPSQLYILDELEERLARPDQWGSFNLSRQRARDLLGLENS